MVSIEFPLQDLTIKFASLGFRSTCSYVIAIGLLLWGFLLTCHSMGFRQIAPLGDFHQFASMRNHYQLAHLGVFIDLPLCMSQQLAPLRSILNLASRCAYQLALMGVSNTCPSRNHLILQGFSTGCIFWALQELVSLGVFIILTFLRSPLFMHVLEAHRISHIGFYYIMTFIEK